MEAILWTVYVVSFVAATFFRWRGVRAYAATPPQNLSQRFRMNTGKWLSWVFTLLPGIVMVAITISDGWTLVESLGLAVALGLMFLSLMHTIPHL